MMADDRGENRPCKRLDPDPSGAPSAGSAAQDRASLADLLEHAFRGAGSDGRVSREGDGLREGAASTFLHERVLEELAAARRMVELTRAAPALEPDRAPIPLFGRDPFAEEDANGKFDDHETEPAPAADLVGQSRFSRLRTTLAGHGANAARRFRLGKWRRRRLVLLSLAHRHIFDRDTEQLLFCKTLPPDPYSFEETENGVEKSFAYRGPMPKKLLDWALSVLPPDLKRYAFIDFRAGNGRTLLLAARRNFEYAAGYAFDADGAATLEMNLAQYPRSYLGCRDVRALRGDRDGVTVPVQPAVLFFPATLSGGHRSVILSYIAESLRAVPRPIYLIFEGGEGECNREEVALFDPAPLSLLTRAKVFLFAPARIAVYRSRCDLE